MQIIHLIKIHIFHSMEIVACLVDMINGKFAIVHHTVLCMTASKYLVVIYCYTEISLHSFGIYPVLYRMH